MEIQPKAGEIFLDKRRLNSSSQRFQQSFADGPVLWLAFSLGSLFARGGKGHSGGHLLASTAIEGVSARLFRGQNTPTPKSFEAVNKVLFEF